MTLEPQGMAHMGPLPEPADVPKNDLGAAGIGRGAEGPSARGKAEIYVEMDFGSIAYYTKDKRFQAVCGNPLHGNVCWPAMQPCGLTCEAAH